MNMKGKECKKQINLTGQCIEKPEVLSEELQKDDL